MLCIRAKCFGSRYSPRLPYHYREFSYSQTMIRIFRDIITIIGKVIIVKSDDDNQTESKAPRPQIRKSCRVELYRNITSIILLLCLTIPQAVCYLLNIGPWTSADPDMHVPATYALATGQIFPKMTAQSKDQFGNRVRYPIISGDSRYLTNEGIHNALVQDIIQNPFSDKYATKQQISASHIYIYKYS